MAAHVNGSVAENGTYIGGAYSHIGQIFFDQDLIANISTYYPYTEDTATLMTNAEDGIYEQQNTGYDALASYELLGDSLEDGLLAWISIGIDPTADNSDAASGGGAPAGGDAPGNGTMPSGMPSGTGPIPSGAMPTGPAPSA